MRRALWTVCLLSIAGSVFSGTLAYRELFGSNPLVCPSPGAAGTLLGYPACVYGFALFVVIAVASGWGLYVGGGTRMRATIDRMPNE